MFKKDLISVNELSPEEIAGIFDLTDQLKKDPVRFSKTLAGKTLVLLFQKPSNRTRVSFEAGMYQLGGNTIYLGGGEVNLGVREAVKDAARTLSRYVDAIVLRTFEHKNVLEMAEYSDKPVINGLSDFAHPCQALADLYTIREKKGKLKGLTLAYIGDANNVCNSLVYICAKLGVNINIAAPKKYSLENKVLEEARVLGEEGFSVDLFEDPFEAVKGSDVLYTDVWVSMGQEKESAGRKKIFRNFQVNSSLLSAAKKDALVMHCLPCHRGEEITDEVVDGPNSVVFDQAENRMHAQKAILIKLLKGEEP